MIVKYPLSPEAKQSAKALVEAWQTGAIGQIVSIHIQSGDNEVEWNIFNVIGSMDGIPTIKRESFMELSLFNLINIDAPGQNYLEILLLEELRNAVENDFAVSDYFLTMNAIGIFNAGGNINNYGILNAAASSSGNIEQHGDQVADELIKMLGGVITKNQELETAITELQEADESTFNQRLGNVVMQLGNLLGHGANTAAIIQALAALKQFI